MDPLPEHKSRKLFGANQPQKTHRNAVSRDGEYMGYSPNHQPELVVAGLQKAQCYHRDGGCPRDNSPHFTFQLNLPSATLRSRKSRNTLIRFEVRSSSG